MTTMVKNRFMHEIEDLPDNKINSVIDYIHFLKNEDEHIKNPNKETEKVFKDTDAEKNLNSYDNINDFFNKMES